MNIIHYAGIKEYCEAALKKWDKNIELLIVIEEFTELIKAITKLERDEYFPTSETLKRKHHNDLIDEIADSVIMLNQLINIYQIDESLIKDRIAYKISRGYEIIEGV